MKRPGRSFLIAVTIAAALGGSARWARFHDWSPEPEHVQPIAIASDNNKPSVWTHSTTSGCDDHGRQYLGTCDCWTWVPNKPEMFGSYCEPKNRKTGSYASPGDYHGGGGQGGNMQWTQPSGTQWITVIGAGGGGGAGTAVGLASSTSATVYTSGAAGTGQNEAAYQEALRQEILRHELAVDAIMKSPLRLEDPR